MFSGVSGYLGPVLGTLGLALFAGLSGGVYYYKNAYETALKDNATVTQQYSQSLVDLKTCSDKTETFKKASDEKLAAAEDALSKAQANTKIIRVNVDRILEAKSTSTDSCIASKNLFKSYLTESNSK